MPVHYLGYFSNHFPKQKPKCWFNFLFAVISSLFLKKGLFGHPFRFVVWFIEMQLYSPRQTLGSVSPVSHSGTATS